MPWGPCGREERRRRGGGVCRPGVRWERGAWTAGRDSGRDTTLELHQPTPIWITYTIFLWFLQLFSTFTAQTLILYVDLPRNWTTLVRVLLWAALVLGRRVPCPSDTLNMSKPNTHTLILQSSAASQRPYDLPPSTETHFCSIMHVKNKTKCIKSVLTVG